MRGTSRRLGLARLPRASRLPQRLPAMPPAWPSRGATWWSWWRSSCSCSGRGCGKSGSNSSGDRQQVQIPDGAGGAASAAVAKAAATVAAAAGVDKGSGRVRKLGLYASRPALRGALRHSNGSDRSQRVRACCGPLKTAGQTSEALHNYDLSARIFSASRRAGRPSWCFMMARDNGVNGSPSDLPAACCNAL